MNFVKNLKTCICPCLGYTRKSSDNSIDNHNDYFNSCSDNTTCESIKHARK